MAIDRTKAEEAAARALCRLAGNPENAKFEGRLMWESYMSEAKAAIDAALPHLGLGNPKP